MNVEQSRVGVDVGRQHRGTVTHRFLSRPQRDARIAVMRSESPSQWLNIKHSSSIVALRDASSLQVLIKDLSLFARHHEEELIGQEAIVLSGIVDGEFGQEHHQQAVIATNLTVAD